MPWSKIDLEGGSTYEWNYKLEKNPLTSLGYRCSIYNMSLVNFQTKFLSGTNLLLCNLTPNNTIIVNTNKNIRIYATLTQKYDSAANEDSWYLVIKYENTGSTKVGGININYETLWTALIEEIKT